MKLPINVLGSRSKYKTSEAYAIVLRFANFGSLANSGVLQNRQNVT